MKKNRKLPTLVLESEGWFLLNNCHYNRQDVALFLNMLGFPINNTAFPDDHIFEQIARTLLLAGYKEDPFRFNLLFEFFVTTSHDQYPLLALIISNVQRKNFPMFLGS